MVERTEGDFNSKEFRRKSHKTLNGDPFLTRESVLISSSDACKVVSEQVETALAYSPTKSIRPLDVGIPISMVHRKFRLQAHKVQTVQHL
ncbi:hypothetical protein NPIL_593931 [Nephila pilipes]|uniref:Uncharacterized protein n=1 Tax=Nephila pilipes TaxID=299642 RepID=A0A8X6NA23_NEPPI|nr:hypothetical protein NPIL_593931 [Nephila pilipes]